MAGECYSIHDMPEEERPRERLLRYGPEAISSTELVAILLSSGTKGRPVLQVANELVGSFGGLKKLGEATVEELCQVRGLGVAKALQLKASFALGMRISQQSIPQKYRVEHPLHAYNLVKDELEGEKRELFVIIMQDIKGYVIRHEVVAIGTLSNTLVHPREVFYPAIRHKASSIILVHNHPSGDPTPSKQDFEITDKLVKVGALMGIPVHDHIIIGSGTYISLRQQGIPFA